MAKIPVARNIIWNWAGRFTEAGVGFFVAPFLIHRLGESTYGLWTVIASLTGYFGLLDLGLQGSVGRYIAFYRAKNDPEAVNFTLSTGALILSGMGILAAAGVLGLTLIFFKMFDVPADQVESARLALFLVAGNLALMISFAVFDATLWAFHRFDILNVIDMTTALARAGLTFWLIQDAGNLVTLGLITLGATFGNGLAKAVLALHQDKSLIIRRAYVRMADAPQLLSYGLWRIIISLGRMATSRISPLIIGCWLTLSLVTPYAIAVRLLTYFTEALVALRISLTPVATVFHAQQSHERQQRLMVQGSQFGFALALFFLTVATFLGDSLVKLWVGPNLAYASRLLLVLVVGEIIPMSQSAATSVILGMARHRTLAWLSLLEIALLVVLALVLVGPFGLIGVCLAQAVAATVCRGLLQMIFACRLAGLPIWRYVVQSMCAPLAISSLPAAALAVAVSYRFPQRWSELIIYGFTYSVAFAISLLILAGYGREGQRQLGTIRNSVSGP